MGRLDRFWEYIEVFHHWRSLNLNSKMGNFGLNSLNGLFGERIVWRTDCFLGISQLLLSMRNKPRVTNILLIHFLGHHLVW